MIQTGWNQQEIVQNKEIKQKYLQEPKKQIIKILDITSLLCLCNLLSIYWPQTRSGGPPQWLHLSSDQTQPSTPENNVIMKLKQLNKNDYK